MLTYKELQQLLRPIQEQTSYINNNNDLQQSKIIESSGKQKINQNSKSKVKISDENQSKRNISAENMQSKTSISVQNPKTSFPKDAENIQIKANISESKKSSTKNIANIRYELILSHKQLKNIPASIPFNNYKISRLDLSFNYLKNFKISQLSDHNLDLEFLGISFNFFTNIENIGMLFRNLKVIDANANRIQSINITQEQFPVLQALYLKNNKIKYFLHCPKSIQILCLDHNQLTKLAFSGGNNLQILSASFNKIQQFQLQEHEINYLCFLDLQNNLIHDIKKLIKILIQCQNLLSLNMIDNYISRIQHKKYMVEVLMICHKILKIDQQIINPHVRDAFKIMRQQELVQMQMKQTEQKYLQRMEQQFRLKQEMMDKIREQQRQLQGNFEQFMKKEKQQMDVLESYAKNNLGKKKFAIIHENVEFKQLTTNYKNKGQPIQQQQIEENKTSRFTESQVEQIKQSGAIEKHKDEYNKFKRSLKNSRKQIQQSKLRNYSKMSKIKSSEQLEQEEDQKSELSSEEQLSNKEIERRKKNMRNPSLVYRNSNQLIGIKEIILENEGNIQEDDQVFNPKCLPYLVRKYGFHTVV